MTLTLKMFIWLDHLGFFLTKYLLQNFSQDLDEKEELEEEDDKSVYPMKEWMRSQDTPVSVHSALGKMLKVSTPVSPIIVGSVYSSTNSRGTLIFLSLPFFVMAHINNILRK